MTVYKPLQAEVYAAAEVAVRLLHGEPIDDLTGGQTIYNGMNRHTVRGKWAGLVLTVDNIAETVIADGFRTWDEIYVGDFERYCPDDR